MDSMIPYGMDEDLELDGLETVAESATLPQPYSRDALPAIVLAGDALMTLKGQLRQELDAAKSRPLKADDLKRWRDYYALAKPAPPWPDAPTHTLPTLKGKIKGLKSTLKQQMNRDPFYTLKAYSSEAKQAQPAMELKMQRNLEITRSLNQIFASMHEAALTGTCFVGVSVANLGGTVVVPLKAYRLENFFVSPVGAEDLTYASTFVRAQETQYEIRQKQAEGYYDGAETEQLLTNVQPASQPLSDVQERDGLQQPSHLRADTTMYEIWECYYRYNGILYRVVYSYDGNRILHLQESPYKDAIDYPPYVPIRIETEVDNIYGHSLAQDVEGMQEVTDEVYNTHAAQRQFEIAKPRYVRQGSSLAEQMRGPMVPGATYFTEGDPREDIYFPPNDRSGADAAMREIQLTKEITDAATFPDTAFGGQPIQNVRTATEVNHMMNGANSLLEDVVQQVASDLEILADTVWALLYEFQIKPERVSEVTRGDDEYMLSAEGITPSAYQERLAGFAMEVLGFDPYQAQEIAFQVGANKVVPSAKRDDIAWRVNGSALISNKMQRAQIMERLMDRFPLLEYAQENFIAYHILKSYLENLDVHWWRTVLPVEPPQPQGPTDWNLISEITGMIRNMRQGGKGTGQ